MNGDTPGPWKVARILGRTGLRRMLNRISSQRRSKKKEKRGRSRSPTPGKKRFSGGLVLLMALIFIPQSFFLSVRFIGSLADRCEAIVAPPPEIESSDADGEEIARPEILSRRPFSGKSLWPEVTAQALMVRSIGVFLLLLWTSLLFMSLGSANQDLGKVEWSFEWLYSFPVPASGLFLAKILEGVFVNAMGWIIVLPFLVSSLWVSGWEFTGIPIALMAAFYFLVLISSARVLIETWLRKNSGLARLKNFQALFTLIGMILWFSVIALALTPRFVGSYVALVASLPAIEWNPLSLPALSLGSAAFAPLIAISFLPLAALFASAAIRACQRLVRDGLLRNSSAYQGSRARAPESKSKSKHRASIFRGVAGKEFLLLKRDRNFMMQTLILPLFIIGFQVIINPSLLSGTTGDVRHSATFAFGVGAYVLACSGFQSLASEGKGLWILYTLPWNVNSLILQKAKMWCVVALLFTAALLVIMPFFGADVSMATLGYAAVALVGVVIYSFIATAMGVLGTNPLETEVRRRINPTLLQAYLLVASLYAFAIYSESIWQKIAQIILSAVLAAALWQKVRDRLPYLLDPTAAPPPRLSLSDGLIAVLAFFVLQGLLVFLFQAGGKFSIGATLAFSFAISGLLISLFCLYSFWRLKVPDILKTVGLVRPSGRVVASVIIATVVGAALACFGHAYMWTIDNVPALETLRQAKDEAYRFQSTLGDDVALWIAIAAIFAAPVFEEFLFRGLVHQGLRRSCGPILAAVASAAIFAIVHPAISVVPVFAMGFAAACVFERAKNLYAPMATHAAYNIGILLF